MSVSRPSNTNAPAAGSSRPASKRKSVLLPEPLVPTTPMRAYPFKLTVTPERTDTPSYACETPSSSSVLDPFHEGSVLVLGGTLTEAIIDSIVCNEFTPSSEA